MALSPRSGSGFRTRRQEAAFACQGAVWTPGPRAEGRLPAPRPRSLQPPAQRQSRGQGALQEGAWPVPPTAGGQPPPGHLSRRNLPSEPSDVAPAQRSADWVLSHVLPTRDHACEMFTTESDTQQDCSQRYTEAAVAAGTVSQARWRRMGGQKGERASFIAQIPVQGPAPTLPERLPTTQALQASRPSSARW